MSQAAVNKYGAAVGGDGELEEAPGLVGGRGVLVVAGDRDKLDVVGGADIALVLLPGVGISGVACAAEADDSFEGEARDEGLQLIGRRLAAAIQGAFGYDAVVAQAVVRSAEEAA